MHGRRRYSLRRKQPLAYRTHATFRPSPPKWRIVAAPPEHASLLLHRLYIKFTPSSISFSTGDVTGTITAPLHFTRHREGSRGAARA
jgi:hypothetical protein